MERDTISPHHLDDEADYVVAALMLAGEGRIELSDALSKYAPEFSQMRVLRQKDGGLEDGEECEEC